MVGAANGVNGRVESTRLVSRSCQSTVYGSASPRYCGMPDEHPIALATSTTLSSPVIVIVVLVQVEQDLYRPELIHRVL